MGSARSGTQKSSAWSRDLHGGGQRQTAVLRFTDDRTWGLLDRLADAIFDPDPSAELYGDGLVAALIATLLTEAAPSPLARRGLAPWHFARAFKASTGLAWRRWASCWGARAEPRAWPSRGRCSCWAARDGEADLRRSVRGDVGARTRRRATVRAVRAVGSLTLALVACSTAPLDQLDGVRGLDAAPSNHHDGGAALDAAAAPDAAAVPDAGFLALTRVSAPAVSFGERRTCRQLCGEAGLACAQVQGGERPAAAASSRVYCRLPSLWYHALYRCDDPLTVALPGCLDHRDPVEDPNGCHCGRESSTPTDHVPVPRQPPRTTSPPSTRAVPARDVVGLGTCTDACRSAGLSCLSFAPDPGLLSDGWGPASFGAVVDCGEDLRPWTADCGDLLVAPLGCVPQLETAGCVCHGE